MAPLPPYLRQWRNWYTRPVCNRAPDWDCGFESRLPHYMSTWGHHTLTVGIPERGPLGTSEGAVSGTSFGLPDGAFSVRSNL